MLHVKAAARDTGAAAKAAYRAYTVFLMKQQPPAQLHPPGTVYLFNFIEHSDSYCKKKHYHHTSYIETTDL